MKKIAIIGNGQLASMLIDSCKDFMFNIDVYDHHTFLLKDNYDGVIAKMQQYDVITYEIENISFKILERISKYTSIYPSINILQISQDRLCEKQFFKDLNIPTNHFILVNSEQDLLNASSILGFPFVLKQRFFGYDGKGQILINNLASLKHAFKILGKNKLIAEQFVNFDFEISQIVTRDIYNKIVFYPLVLNIHEKGILIESIVVQQNDNFWNDLSCLTKKYAYKVINKVNYIGTLTIEFFVKNKTLYANEIAPRVHNSGHWSINGCNVSQFRNHMLAISNNHIHDIYLKNPYIIMINIIGQNIPIFNNLDKNIFIKNYYKVLKNKRKMGHINILEDNLSGFLKTYDIIYNKIIQQPHLHINNIFNQKLNNSLLYKYNI